MDNWIKNAKDDKWNTIQTVLHEWGLVSLTIGLPDNDVSSDDSVTVDREVKYRESWDRDRFRAGPALR